jgi:hypothetical protein
VIFAEKVKVMRAYGALAATIILGTVALPLTSAHAIFAIPEATPVAGAGMDTVTLDGTYDSVPSPAMQPFAALPFTLTMTLPSEVYLNQPSLEFTVNARGSYTNAGQTETFSGQPAFFGSISGAFSLNVSGLISPGDFFSLDVTNLQSLYQPVILASTVAPSQPFYMLTLGTLTGASGSADYVPAGDPNFGGTITVTSAVPEPASWALMSVGIIALGATRLVRRARRA